MVKAFIVLQLILVLFLANRVMAHGGGHQGQTQAGQTPSVCTILNDKVCAHLFLLTELSPDVEGQFIVHVTPQDGEIVKNLGVELWMNMGHGKGHGSAPVDLESLGDNKYKVTNAWFVMAGPWIVRLSFEIDQDYFEIEIPVTAK